MAEIIHPLQSSWLSEVSWDPVTQHAEVTFLSGYVWTGTFTPDEFSSLVSAPSPGRWWHQNIMGR